MPKNNSKPQSAESPLFHTKPLQTALQNLASHHAGIADGETKRISMDAEIKALLDKIDPMDEAAVQIVSSRKAQADLLPIFIKKAKLRHPALVEAFLPAIQDLEKEITDRVAADQELYRQEVEPLFRALMPGTVGADGTPWNPGHVPMWNSRHVPSVPIFFPGQEGGVGESKMRSYKRDGESFESWESDLTRIADGLLKTAAEYKPYQPGKVKRLVAPLVA